MLRGGAVGVELAQAFARFGSRVDVVETGDGLLPTEEPDSDRLPAEVYAREEVGVDTK